MRTIIRGGTTFSILTLFVFLFVFMLSFFTYGQKLLPIPKPTHSEAGVKCARFKVVKEIQSDFVEDIFFAHPTLLSASKGGFLYVFDAKLMRIFVFDQKFKYLRQFMREGRGPGEIMPGRGGNVKIYAGPDNDIYVCDSVGDRMIRFSPQGKIVKETRMNRVKSTFTSFPPVVDKDGFLYVYSLNNGIVDKVDGDMNLIHTYLDRNLTKRFVVYRPPFEEFLKGRPLSVDIWFNADDGTADYDVTEDGRLIIYLFRSSTAFIFKGKKLIHSFDVLLERTISGFRKFAGERMKRRQNLLAKGMNVLGNARMFSTFFIDKDAPFFYLLYTEGKKYGILYCFNFNGKLVKLYEDFVDKGYPVAKVNGLFYGWTFGDKHPIIFKEEGTP